MVVFDEDVDAEVGEGGVGEVVVDLELGVEGFAFQGGFLEDLKLDAGADGALLGLAYGGSKGQGDESAQDRLPAEAL